MQTSIQQTHIGLNKFETSRLTSFYYLTLYTLILLFFFFNLISLTSFIYRFRFIELATRPWYFKYVVRHVMITVRFVDIQADSRDLFENSTLYKQ